MNIKIHCTKPKEDNKKLYDSTIKEIIITFNR